MVNLKINLFLDFLTSWLLDIVTLKLRRTTWVWRELFCCFVHTAWSFVYRCVQVYRYTGRTRWACKGVLVCLTRYMEENVGTSTQKEKINMSKHTVHSLERQIMLTTMACTHPIPKSMYYRWGHLKPNPNPWGRVGWFSQKWVPSTPVLLNLLITLRNKCHLEFQVGGMCKEHGAAGTSTRAFANHCFSRLKFVGTTWSEQE